jgi:AhpD family alkylhydroperoxidase
MKLDIRVRELIAIGTAIGANCHVCLKHHAAKAHEENVPDDEIAEAIEVGKAVRKGAQGSMDKLANELLSESRATLAPAAADCGCGHGRAESPTAA